MTTAERKTSLVLGAGGLGAPAALGLAASGVERLLLVDGAPVELTDLPLLPFATEADLGRTRAEALAGALSRLAPDVEVSVSGALDLAEITALARQAGVLVDAADRFDAMFLACDAAAAAGVPLVHGGLLLHSVQLLTVQPGLTGCLRCLFEAPPANERRPVEPGVLGPLAGLAGSLLAAEASRLLGGAPPAYAGQLVTWEGRSGWSRAVPVPRRAGCAACGALVPAPATPEVA